MPRELTLRNETGQIVTIVPTRDLAFRYIKHECPDGEYSIVGPGIDMTFYRINGVAYPSGGTIDGQKIPPRSRVECIKTFG